MQEIIRLLAIKTDKLMSVIGYKKKTEVASKDSLSIYYERFHGMMAEIKKSGVKIYRIKGADQLELVASFKSDEMLEPSELKARVTKTPKKTKLDRAFEDML